MNFGRAYLSGEGTDRNDWVARRIVIELCRFLAGQQSTDDQSTAPTELFLSHAKADLGAEPKVAQKLIDSLKADQPVDAWVDSGEIEAGSKFAEAITNGVKSALRSWWFSPTTTRRANGVGKRRCSPRITSGPWL